MEAELQQRLDEFLMAEIDVRRCVVAIKQGGLSSQGVVQMCTAVNAKLSGLSTKIMELEVDVEASDRSSSGSREPILKALAQHRREMDDLRTAVRAASLAHTRKMASRRLQQDRLELLGGPGREGQKESTLGSEVVQSLQRARGLISKELEKTNDTMRMLDEGSEKLKHAHAEYQAHRGAMSTNTQLLSKLATRMMTDAAFVYFAFVVYLAVCCYILWRRLV